MEMYNEYSLPFRIERKIERVTESGCWIWTGFLSKSGYGKVTYKSKDWRIHRLVYTLVKGLIPKNMWLDHLCRVRCCVNPDHLEAVTPRENILRGISPSALAVKRKTCIRGHLYDSVSKTIRGTFQRVCSICAKASNKKYLQNKKLKKRFI